MELKEQVAYLPSAARTATINGADIQWPIETGIIVYLNVTAASGLGGLSVFIQGLDPASGTYVNLNPAPTAVIATGLTTYVLYPSGGTDTAITQLTNGMALPAVGRIRVQHGDASSYTYSVGYSTLK